MTTYQPGDFIAVSLDEGDVKRLVKSVDERNYIRYVNPADQTQFEWGIHADRVKPWHPVYAFKQGDFIDVEGKKREFLATREGRVYYMHPEWVERGATSAYDIDADKVTQWVDPFAFELGDRIRARDDSNNYPRLFVYTVICIDDKERVAYLAYWDALAQANNKVKTSQVDFYTANTLWKKVN